MQAVLFDLDETLIARRAWTVEAAFTGYALRRMRGLGSPLALLKAGKAAVRAAKSAHGFPTNLEAMAQSFATSLGCDAQEALARLEVLAQEDFGRLAWGFRPVPGALASVAAAQAKGLRIALVTNPTTPEALVRWRLRWLGLDEAPWALVTHAGNMRATKPMPAFYEAVAQALALAPSACLMVGDDLRRDGAAREVGMAFWHLLPPGRRPGPGVVGGDHAALQGHLATWAAAGVAA